MLRPRFLRRQFSLAALFGVVTLAALVAAGYGMRQRALSAEDRAMRIIASKGGTVQVWDGGVTVRFDSSTSQITDCGLAAWGRKYQPSGSSADFTDDDLALIDNVRRIQGVDLGNTRISSSAVQQFRSKYPQCRVEF